MADVGLAGEPEPIPGGAALTAGSEGRAFVLIDDGDPARFGPALAWAHRRRSPRLDLYVDGSPLAAGVVARRAALLARPPTVWALHGRQARQAEPSPSATPPAGGGPPAELARLLAAHGLEVVWEHGVLRGEVLGLEVARTVGDHLEVGVGRHDRLARLEMRPGETLSEALDSAAAAVRRLRRPGAPVHPANTLARGRWLRALLVRSPQVVEAEALEPAPPPLPWFDLPEAGAAPAIGWRPGGRRLVAVCSVGVDLDLVPAAADCRLALAPDADLVLVLPEGDDLPVTRDLAGALALPAEVVTVPRDWPAGLRVAPPVA